MGRTRAATAAASLLLAGALGLGAPSPAAAQDPDDGLATTGRSTYVVDVAARAIHVAVDLSATNTVPDTARGFTYFASIGVVTLAEVVDVVATTADGAPLSVEVEPIDGNDLVAVVRIDLPERLRYQDTQRIHLTYDLPDQGPRASRITRVNPAFVAVIPLPFGDPGAADVTVLVPDGFGVELSDDTPLTSGRAGDQQSFTATAIADPSAFDGTVIARDLDVLERTATASEHDIEVAAWPGDTEWADFVAGVVEDGVPVLEELIARPWPVDGSLDIVETVAPYLYGYAGWYNPADDRIEVGDELDPHVVLHELSHAWFQFEHFDDRWICEGLAEQVSTRALERLGIAAPSPAPIDPASEGAVRLSDWSTPSLSADISDEQEAYGYNASFAVVRAVADEIGTDGLARVIEAAMDDRIAYRGDPEPEPWTSGTGTRRFLDLLEEVGGATTASALFGAHVLPEADLPILARRAEVRATYDALEAAGADWTPPFAVRLAMANWDFDAAAGLITESQGLLATRDSIAVVASDLGLDLPTDLEVEYEEAHRLGVVATQAKALLDATDDLEAAQAAVDRDRGMLDRIGLLGDDPEDDLEAAFAAFDRADAGDVEAASAAAIATVEGAGRAGLERLAAVAALVLLAAVTRRGWRAIAAGADSRAMAAAVDRLRSSTPPPDDEPSP
jgi:hypothetical protein